MIKDVKYVFIGMTYGELRDVLVDNPKTKIFPLVDNDQNMILLGSVHRNSLQRLLNAKVGEERRYETVIRQMDDIQEEPEPETRQPFLVKF